MLSENTYYDNIYPQYGYEGLKSQGSPAFSQDFQNHFYPLEEQQVIYSPYQPFLKKRIDEIPPELDDFNNQRTLENAKIKNQNQNRKTSTSLERTVKKRVCRQNQNEECDLFCQEQTQNSTNDLEKLVDDIKLECKQNYQESEGESIFIYKPSSDQELFLKSYVNENIIKQLQKDVTLVLAKDDETKKFVSWIDNLCSESNNESLKELQRKQKVQKYIEKKRNRTYEKKVHYHMRQKVAEERLRIKGKFVTWSKAINLLSQTSEFNKNLDYRQIRNMVKEKFGNNRSIKNYN